jgi:hypothetical protein
LSLNDQTTHDPSLIFMSIQGDHMIHFNKVFPIITLLLVVSVARADKVTTDFDHKANFATYHTFSWGAVTTVNSLNESRIKRDIAKQLQAKGWQLMPSGGAVTVVVTGNVKNEQELETMYDGLGGGWGGGWGFGGFDRFGGGGEFGGGGFGEATTTTTEQPVGSLVVDLLDTSSKKLLFRGLSSGDVSSKSKNNTKNLVKDVEKMFKDFPPKA